MLAFTLYFFILTLLTNKNMNKNPPQFIRVFSDIHLDFDVPHKTKNFTPDMLWMPEPLDTDKESILILAGDLWHSKNYYMYNNYSWITEVAKKFYFVIVVLGNHDFWGGSIPKEYNKFQNFLKESKIQNVHLLQNNSITMFEKVKFVGGTLWTDYNKGSKDCFQGAKKKMKDYRFIRQGIGIQSVSPYFLYTEHQKTKLFIENNAFRDFPEQKLWVITHHLPTMSSIPFSFNQIGMENENALYYSDMENLITKVNADCWVHGHSHLFQHYMIGNTTIIANPRGYTHENSNYNPWVLYDFDGNILESTNSNI